ncbi:hypothetical protein BKH46_03030 [Helicobacter sp. 12S02634-8]|uniref:hypothetical protein n=1 Tax=Helicobacter sp. 12S02634-8 TaxID=1476199 RepID=UPI000BA6A53C|nr:hypothetical protein [Helicobacter sp. 12S02634-8]PAF47820.1 hypothetical protein BKH46_03030 [Helicobacter sp. 12S02634-8]
MKKASMILAALLLAGCVSLKIKTESPHIQEYDLSDNTLGTLQCKQYSNLALIGISSASIYETRNILKRLDNGQIESIDGKKWIDLPKNMFANLLVQEASKRCILVSFPPFGASNPQKMLKINLLSFDIKEGSAPQAIVGLSYEFFVDGKKMEGVLSEQEPIKENSIQALQIVSKRAASDLIELFGTKK